jgi:hypothetical protein
MARDPINPTDDEARALARGLLATARFGALAVNAPDGPAPLVSRVAVLGQGAAALLLVSDLSLHAKALAQDPHCSLLVGEPGARGDPLTHPRMTLVGRALPEAKAAQREAWLAAHPKSALYFDFADFRMLRLAPEVIHLNGGFGKAYRLTAGDLG